MIQNKLLQKSELSIAEIIFLHNPSTETFMSSLHPRGALFECATDITKAHKSHKNILNALLAKGVKIITVESFCENMLKSKDQKDIENFLKFVGKSLTYRCYYSENLTEKQQFLLTDQYKLEVLRSSTASALANILITRPLVQLEISPKNTELQTTNVQFRPLGNLVFMRDHLIVTSNGPVFGRMASKQRKSEVKLIKNIFHLLKIPFFEVPNALGYELEGGDYMATEEREFIGVGLRTTWQSVEFLFENQIFNKDKIVVVIEDLEDRNQQRTHLDTIFNIVEEKMVVVHEGLLGLKPKYQRQVKEFVCKEGKFSERSCEHDLEKYLKSNGFTIIPISEKEQQEYMINFLNLGKDKGIISVHKGLEAKLRAVGFKGDVQFVEYEGILAMYGGVHCSTQVFREGSVYDALVAMSQYKAQKKKSGISTDEFTL